MCATPNAFEDEGSCLRLCHTLERLAGVHSPFSVERPGVEVGRLSGLDRDYVILVNHTSGARLVRLDAPPVVGGVLLGIE